MDELYNMIYEKSIKFGDFTLRSGKKSNFYVDCRPVILSVNGRNLIKEKIANLLDFDFDFFVATGVGGSYLACSVGDFLHKDVIHIRDSKKDHGTKNKMELPFNFFKGCKVVIIDDVLTSGNSIFTCIDEINSKTNIVSCIVLIDREEGGKEFIEDNYEIPILSVFKKSDFLKDI